MDEDVKVMVKTIVERVIRDLEDALSWLRELDVDGMDEEILLQAIHKLGDLSRFVNREALFLADLLLQACKGGGRGQG